MNITEYVTINGEYDFSELEFNVVDSLVICQLSYLKYDGALPGPDDDGKGITLRELSKSDSISQFFMDERYAENNRALFDACVSSRRFGRLFINNYINIVDTDIDVQFAAMTLSDGDTFNYVVFRGTDDNMVGWKEDMNMTFMTPVPAQKYAVEYINKVAAKLPGDILVGGHSKGGNLSVYAAMYCVDSVRERIIRIYSHDGPGFRMSLVNNADYEKIADRIIKLIPKAAIVGMLGNVENYEVVECEKIGVMQHNPFNWIVEGNDFKRADQVKKHSRFRALALNPVVDEVPPEQWEYLSDKLFEVFDAAGITNLNDFYSDFFGTLGKIRDVSDEIIDDELRDIVRALAGLIKESAEYVAKEDAKENLISAEDELMKAKNEVVILLKKAQKGASASLKKVKEEASEGIQKVKEEASEGIQKVKEEASEEIQKVKEDVSEKAVEVKKRIETGRDKKD